MRDLFTIAKETATSSSYLKKNVTAEKGFSFRYLFYRIARPLLKVNYKVFKWRNPVTPWTAQAAVEIFNRILTKQMIGLEYGSGNSTPFLARHLKHLTSVEHDQTWHALVKTKLDKMGITNVDYQLIRPGSIRKLNYSFYKEYKLDENEFSVRLEYADYFDFARAFPENHFDVIMIDGRARIECALNAIPKLRPGGIFVLDNSDRRRYRTIFKVLSGWRMVTTTTGLFDTTFWFKP